jgi:hypothetical protein
MVEPPAYSHLQDGPSCDIKLKPTKFPKNVAKSKKVHKLDYFIRKIKDFNHIYSISNNLYIVSLFIDFDPISWIDENEDKIKERINEYRNISSNRRI